MSDNMDESIMLSDINQKDKVKYHMIFTYCSNTLMCQLKISPTIFFSVWLCGNADDQPFCFSSVADITYTYQSCEKNSRYTQERANNSKFSKNPTY